MPELPVVVVPVGIYDVPLDRCLAALDASTPPVACASAAAHADGATEAVESAA